MSKTKRFTATLIFRLSPEDRKFVIARAQAEKMTVGEFLRFLIERARASGL